MGNSHYHEPPELLSDHSNDLHRAIASLMEELEAIDWYQQRVEACTDAKLREILIHNKNEEIEHAFMILEWIRRRDPLFDSNARTYLFSKSSIIQARKHIVDDDAAGDSSTQGSLGIGCMKG